MTHTCPSALILHPSFTYPLASCPPHYMFELSKSELQDLRSKILTTNVSVMNRNSTKVFTERGLYMLAMP